MADSLNINTKGIFRPVEPQAFLRAFGVVGKCAVYVFAGVITTGLSQPASARSISDLFACAKENISVAELADHFERRNWNGEKPKSKIIQKRVMFLGNVDAASPATWKATADWATELADETAHPSAIVFATITTAVSIDVTAHGHIACLIVSDENLEAQFEAELPDLNLRDYAGRTFARLVNPTLQISATFLSAEAAALSQLAGGRKTSATILNKTASLKEE